MNWTSTQKFRVRVMFFFFRTRKLTELVTEDTNNLETPISINNDDKVIVQPKVLGKKKKPLNQI